MSQIKKDLSIRSENIQRVYEYYRAHKFTVNRRYQRKLVWSLEEKIAFIDSINKGYPVPLFLLAEIEYEGEDKFEIIDGMQRLNAMMSFIDQEFDYNSKYFDLETMVETKLALDNKEIDQKEPRLDRETCAKIASYVLPLSVYKNKSSSELDEIFRRINSGGRLLSRQELRQSGSLGDFATTVRKIAANIRGDVSVGDKLSLNSMKEISITSKNLSSYGINVDDIFWVNQNIFRREKVRESRDEELIADMLGGYILADYGSKQSSRSDFIDNYYGIIKIQADKERHKMVETNLAKRTPEVVIEQFMNVFETLRRTLYEAGKTFTSLINRDQAGVPRYFQAVFLAYYELLIEDNKTVQDYRKLALKLNGIDKHIKNYGGGKWPAEAREKNVKAVKGILSSSFRDREPGDLALNSWTTELENILMQSSTEQSLYDFKQGFHGLDDGIFNEKLLSKVVKTLTAIANCGPNLDGYVLVGIANNKEDSEIISKLYSITPTIYNKYYITGVQSEANQYHKNLDKYYQYIIQSIEKEPISKGIKDEISSQSRIIQYFDKSVLVFHIKSGTSPVLYNKKYYIRKGPNISEIEAEGFEALFRKFNKET